MEKGELSVYRIARQQGVTPQWVRCLYRKYLETGEYPYPKHAGRKPVPLDPGEIEYILWLKSCRDPAKDSGIVWWLSGQDYNRRKRDTGFCSNARLK